MVKYFYDKYNSIGTTLWTEAPYDIVYADTDETFGGTYKSYTFDRTSNKYTLTGGTWSGNTGVQAGSQGYFLNGANLINIRAKSAPTGTHVPSARYTKLTSKSTQSTTYSRGTLVQANVIGEDGTYPVDGRHTDGFWYVRKGEANRAPDIIPVETVPSGTIEVKPSFNYIVTDPDGDGMTVTESIDGIVFNTRTGVVSGTQLAFNPTDLSWLRTRIKQVVNITIKADDGKGGVTTVNYPITRTTPAIDLTLKTPFETDIVARRMLLQLDGNIPSDAVVNVQVCNNAFDASPTWENATNLVLRKLPYLFNNTAKTATKWGVSFKIRIERGSSTQPIYLDGVGGAFD